MSVRRVSPTEAAALLGEGYVYVDVRSVPEFEAGHPRGAYNVPLLHSGPGGMQPNPAFLSVMEARFPKASKLVIGCQAGGRSLRAAELLAAEGYANVVDQRAGWGGIRDGFGSVTEAGWQRAGLPSATEADPGHGYAELQEGSRPTHEGT